MVTLVEFMYLVFTGMPSDSYHRQLGSLLYLGYIFRTLINSLAGLSLSEPCDAEHSNGHHTQKQMEQIVDATRWQGCTCQVVMADISFHNRK